jgi:tellurite resistance protein TerC
VLRHGGTQIHPDKNPVLRLIRRVIPATDTLHGHKFFTRVGGRWLATPLLAVLILIESTDVLFAIDSIPAIFAVTRDTFIVFTSNIFALLGMRALYFLLAGAAQRFIYLQTGLAIILAGVGVKLLLTDVYQIPTWASLLFILAVLGGTLGLSWRATRRRGSTAPGPSPGPSPGPGPDEAEPAPTGVLGGGITTGAGRSGCGS